MIQAAPNREPATNDEIARALRETAVLLEQQGANVFRVRAYRHAAETIDRSLRPIAELYDEQGVTGLTQLAGIGRSLGHAIATFLETGHWALRERLLGAHEVEHLFATVANIGSQLSARIHDVLGIETLPELFAAACDGRLSQVPGMGPKRCQAVRETLASRLSGRQVPLARTPERAPWRASAPATEDAPADALVQSTKHACSSTSDDVPVEVLLDIDREYRERARAGQLPRITPHKFNPTREAWLPVLHTERDGRHFTALFSNSARAHELGLHHDWVVIYLDDGDAHGRWTVITAAFGPKQGQRLVRGRENSAHRDSSFHSGER